MAKPRKKKCPVCGRPMPFDRKKYMREYMRKKRAAAKKKPGK